MMWLFNGFVINGGGGSRSLATSLLGYSDRPAIGGRVGDSEISEDQTAAKFETYCYAYCSFGF